MTKIIPTESGCRQGKWLLWRLYAVVFLPIFLIYQQSSYAEPSGGSVYRERIAEMKVSRQGPFSGIRWFCQDGTVRPPRGTGCREHGGGVQHGEWSPAAKQLRNSGYPVATVYAALAEADYAALRSDPQSLSFLLLERFLTGYDDGWIFRNADTYRGALQAEDENAAARELLKVLLSNYPPDQYFLLREAVRLLPRSVPGEFLSTIRATSTRLAAADSRFAPLRNKLHSVPDPSDAERIIEFARTKVPDRRKASYYELARLIEQTYSTQALPDALRQLVALGNSQLSTRADNLSMLLARSRKPQELYAAYADFLLFLREHAAAGGPPSMQLAMLEASIQIEQAFYAVGRLLARQNMHATRADLITALKDTVVAIYGTGALSEREYKAARASLASLETADVAVSSYYHELRYLALVPDWASARLRFDFGQAIERFAQIEPLVRAYIPDRLRQGPLLYYSQIMARLSSDAALLRGLKHTLFGESISTGLRALNPGLARGVLMKPGSTPLRKDPTSAIYLVSETDSELPPVAGILTAREGNLLSHVQLLARNLGIPNIVVEEKLLPFLEARLGQSIVLAATPGGRVNISADEPDWNTVFSRLGRPETLRLDPDLDKLDLEFRRFVSLKDLSQDDSGRIVGPKAAKLGELKKHFPQEVTEGVAIPFGIFRSALNMPYPPGSTTNFFDWLRAGYQEVSMAAPATRQKRTSEMLARVRGAILSLRFSRPFKAEFHAALSRHIGPVGTYGVFVRSDSNVEDLPSFTGAGLNLTVPNVRQFDEIVSAVLQVWASAFSERAFAWRQAAMTEPENVFVSVLLLKSVSAEKSGVMVTADIDTGDPGFLTVAANSGIAGAVSNQAAETLRIARGDGTVRLYSSAATHSKSILAPGGGLETVALQSRERVLSESELLKLHEFAEKLPERFPQMEDSSGESVPAEVEFAFVRGKLVLLQIRPFLQNVQQKQMEYLHSLDRGDSEIKKQIVNLNGVPESDTQ